MTRIINSDGPGKRRNRQMRTAAELLRRLAESPGMSRETKDMAAEVVFALRGVARTAEESAEAWDKRGYWKKAADFQLQWEWAGAAASRLEALLRKEAWEILPSVLAELLPRFSGINVTKYTRPPDVWKGSYDRLLGR